MKRLLLPIFLLAQAFAADGTVRMFTLKFADAEQFRRLFSAFSYPMNANREFNVLTVTAPAAFLTQVEAAVKEFDVAPVPPKNIELAVYLISVTDATGLLPKELQEAYKAYKLADSQVIRIRPGQPAESGGLGMLSQVRFRAGSIGTDDKGRVISIDGLRVQLKAPATAILSSDIDLRENQPVVIGKTSPDGLLIVVAKVAE